MVLAAGHVWRLEVGAGWQWDVSILGACVGGRYKGNALLKRRDLGNWTAGSSYISDIVKKKMIKEMRLLI